MVKKILVFVIFSCIIFLGVQVEVSAKTYTNKEEVYNTIKDNLLDRNEKFIIKMSKKTMKAIGTNTNLFDEVTLMDGESTSKDFDYLRLSVSSWSASWKWSTGGDTATLTFSAEYDTTLEQEKKVDAKIISILKSLNLKKATDYEKVKAIHDYLINRISYDQSLKKHSAYNALIDKSAVCEGYATAAYRLFVDAGLEARIISGTAGGGSHAWNIVKVDGKWYNIDLTWDDPITSTGKQVLRYDYFLKNNKDFSEHVRDAKYKSKAFQKAYPMSKTSYVMD